MAVVGDAGEVGAMDGLRDGDAEGAVGEPVLSHRRGEARRETG